MHGEVPRNGVRTNQLQKTETNSVLKIDSRVDYQFCCKIPKGAETQLSLPSIQINH